MLEHVRFKVRLPGVQRPRRDDRAEDIAGSVAPAPGTAGLLAWLGTSKYVDGLPLHQVAAILGKRFGELHQHDAGTVDDQGQRGCSRRCWYCWTATCCRWITCTPMNHGAGARRARTLCVAEVLLLGAGHRGGATDHPVDYAPSRAGVVAERLLSGFKGYLQSDAYSGYNGIITARGRHSGGLFGACAATLRCGIEVSRSAQQAARAMLAREALTYIRRLYQIEKTIKGMPSAGACIGARPKVRRSSMNSTNGASATSSRRWPSVVPWPKPSAIWAINGHH